MKVIELTRGRVAVVDDEDFEKLAQYRWQCSKGGYATRSGKMVDGKRPCLYMHVVVFGQPVPKGFQVDHRNGDLLDNRRDNLRLATYRQNQQNAKIRIDNLIGVKGVRFRKDTGKYVARIHTDNGKRIQVGAFNTPEEAKRAYDEAAIRFHGEFARTA